MSCASVPHFLGGLLLCAAAIATSTQAAAQDATATKMFGGWGVFCKIDGMTDRTTCDLMAMSTPRGAALIWTEATPDPGLRLVLSDVRPPGAAWLRIARNPPVELPYCTSPDARVCMAAPREDARLAKAITDGATTALVRVGRIDVGRDFAFDLSDFPAAHAELLRLRKAAGQTPPRRPADALERTAVARIEAETQAREITRRREAEQQAVRAAQDREAAARAARIAETLPQRNQFCALQPSPTQVQACRQRMPGCAHRESEADLRDWARCMDGDLERSRIDELVGIAIAGCTGLADPALARCRTQISQCQSFSIGWRRLADCLRNAGHAAIPNWTVPTFTN